MEWIARWNWPLLQLYQVPEPPPTRLFSFMNPLAVEIWLFIVLAYVLVSLSMWVVARFTPYEWHDGVGACPDCNRMPSHHNPYGNPDQHMNQLSSLGLTGLNGDSLLGVSNNFSLGNSFWFTIGTLMQQGSDLNPKVYRFFIAKARYTLYCLLTFFISFFLIPPLLFFSFYFSKLWIYLLCPTGYMKTMHGMCACI